MKHALYLLLLVGVLAGCVSETVAEDQQYCTLKAGFSETDTKVALTLSDSSLDVITKWQESDMIKTYLYGAGRIVENPPVHIHNINPDGKGCEFTFMLDNKIGYLREGYNLLAYTLDHETDDILKPQDVQTAPSLDYSLYRAPLSSFHAPVLFFGHITNNIVYCHFSHLYTYEILHISNLTERDMRFSLNGFESDTQWYQLFCSFDVTNDGVVQGVATTSNCHPVEVSEAVTIPANSTGAIVSAYVPTGQKIRDARMVATIDGNVIKSENTKSSEVGLQQGHVYHMYASWISGVLRFESGETEAPAVETLIAKVDDKNTAALLIGTVTNRSLDGLSTGFRVWKDGNNMDYVEYESTFTQDNMFRLDLSVDDLRHIAGEASLYGLYKAQAFAVDESGIPGYGDIKEFIIVKPSESGVPEAVDLGLSVKWASFNLGATKPEEYGDYFAWGETEPKTEYSYDTYKWMAEGESSWQQISKYTIPDDYTNCRWYKNKQFVGDGKTLLDPEDDAATVAYGSQWRMPTEAEWKELIDNCDFKPLLQDGAYTFEAKSRINGQSIVLPAAGFYEDSDSAFMGERGFYWSSTLFSVTTVDRRTWNAGVFVLWESRAPSFFECERFYGQSIRPVFGPRREAETPYASVSSIDIDLEELVMAISSPPRQLIATISPSNATNKNIIWNSYDPSVATVSSTGLVTPVSAGSTYISATTEDGGKYDDCLVIVKSDEDAYIPDTVDFGLSVKWAVFNLGAISPEDSGYDYAWGETTPKEEYTWDNYIWNPAYGIDKMTDVTVLQEQDDAATCFLGKGWRTPTMAEWDELLNKCNMYVEDYNGVHCIRISRNYYGRIYLPIPDNSCYYWLANLSSLSEANAIHLTYYSSDFGQSCKETLIRCVGAKIRPVYVE